MNLKNLLTRRLRVLPTKVAALVLLVAILGFADASYLTIEHFQNVIPPCSIGGCEKVLTSDYSTILGVPVSLLGAIYYVIVAVGALAYMEGKHEKIFRYSLLLTVFGLLAAIWFTGLQIFVIHSYCPYCLTSAGLSTILFVIAALILTKHYERI